MFIFEYESTSIIYLLTVFLQIFEYLLNYFFYSYFVNKSAKEKEYQFYHYLLSKIISILEPDLNILT